MNEKDKEVLPIRFNSAYYLCKRERPFSDFPSLLELHEKNSVKRFSGSYRSDRAVTTTNEEKNHK